MIKKTFQFLISLTAIFLIIGCNDDPSDLGIGLIDNLDAINVKKVDSFTDSIPQKSSYFKQVIALGGAANLLLGKAENITSHTLLKFVFVIPDSIKTELTNNTINVIDSYVQLTKDYSFGDSLAGFDYGVFKINSKWTSTSFTSDSFATLNSDNTDLSSFREDDNDSVYSFHLSTALVTSWLKNYVDSTVESNNGILLSPTSNTNKVLGFTAFNLNGVNDPRLRIVIQKPGKYIDTLVGYISSDVSAVLGEKPNVGDDNIAIQSSLTSEAKLWFDLSTIPNNSVINSANLIFTVDTIKTKIGSNNNINKINIYLLSDSSKNVVDKNYLYTLTRIGSNFKGSIVNIVRAWHNGISNQGMLVKSATEYYGLEIFVVRGSNAAILSERPKLEIVYTQRK